MIKSLPLRFVASAADLEERVVVLDGSFGPGQNPARTADLHLAHWPENRTPEPLRRDLSTEIAFAYQELPEAQRRALVDGCSAIVLNHYDTDGLCAAFVLTRPETAREHATLLVDAAAAGDFFEVRSDRAFAIDAALRNLADPDRSPAARPQPGESSTARKQRLIELALDLLDTMLRDDSAGEPLWRPDLAALDADRADLAAALHDDLVYLDMAVWMAAHGAGSTRPGAPTAFDPGRHAILGSGRADRALLIGPSALGTTARFIVGTRSFFDVVSRPPSRRPDLARLRDRLNDLEGLQPDAEHAWRHQPERGATPELWFGRDEHPLYAEHAGAALGHSSLDPEAIKRGVLDAVRDAWELPNDDDEPEDGEDIFAV